MFLPRTLSRGVLRSWNKSSLFFPSSVIFSFHPLPTHIIYPILPLLFLIRSLPKTRNLQRDIFTSNLRRPFRIPLLRDSLLSLQVILNTGRRTGRQSCGDGRCVRLRMQICQNSGDKQTDVDTKIRGCRWTRILLQKSIILDRSYLCAKPRYVTARYRTKPTARHAVTTM